MKRKERHFIQSYKIHMYKLIVMYMCDPPRLSLLFLKNKKNSEMLMAGS